MSIERIYEIHLNNKKELIDAFGTLIQKTVIRTAPIEDGSEDRGKYYIVSEKERNNSYMIYLVPKKLYALFREILAKNQDPVIYSVLCGRRNNKEVRVTLFGIPLEEVQKELEDK